MAYYFNKKVSVGTFEEALDLVSAALKKEGFGVLTEIDVQDTLKKKINVDFKKYTILGACNPHFANKALQCEDKIGVLLPCNIIVEENNDGGIEVSAVDPIESMSTVNNESLSEIALEVQQKLKNVIESLPS
ncbi:DUF302 domain-containing protein [Membranihabitans maritimus]|uniref:DUF302 domain-containing protein n=1 Tax=Membranihabitans maritimus TaxID=2904244 RepID=UPI001F26FB21|nr:DUF302 domain-containing protein [Membranihabitans maritimus]